MNTLRTSKVLLASAAIVILPAAPLIAHAQSTGVRSISASLAPSQDDFTFFTRSIFITKLVRFFTLSQESRNRETIAIANALLVQAHTEHDSNQPDTQISATLDDFDKEMNKVLPETLATTSSSTTLDSALTDQTSQVRFLEDLKPQTANELSAKLDKLRAHELADVTKVLENGSLSETDRQEKLSHVLDHYVKEESKVDEKILKKLSLKNEIDDHTTNLSLQTALDSQEDKILDKAPTLTSGELNTVVTEVEKDDSDHSLVTLQRLLGKVPDAAKPGIETALSSKIEHKLPELEKDPQSLDNFLKDHGSSDDIRTALLNRVKEHSKNGDLKQEVEKEVKDIQDQEKSDAENGKSKSVRATANPVPVTPRAVSTSGSNTSGSGSSGSSSSPTPTPNPAVGITIKVRDGHFDVPTIEVPLNARLTIQFENDMGTGNFILTLSNGHASSSTGPNQRVNLDSFIFTGPMTFSTVINGSTVTGNLVIKH